MPWSKIVNLALPYIFIASLFLPAKIEPIYLSSFLWLIIIVHFIFFGKELVKSLDGVKISYLIFTLFVIPVSFFSIEVNSALQNAIYLFQSFYFLLIASQNFGYSYIKRILQFLIVIGSIFSVFAFSKFIEIGQLSNNYLDGLFGLRLVSAGYVSFLLFISIYFSLQKSDKYKHLWILCSAILLNALIYSGSYLFIIQTLVFFAIYYFIKNKELKFRIVFNREIIKISCSILLVAFILYCGILYFARNTTLQNTDKINQELLSLNQNKIHQNNSTAMGDYLSDNLYLFLSRPFNGLGYGLGNLATESVRETLNYGEYTEQYSLPLKILVENGIILFILFAVFTYQIISKFCQKLKGNLQKDIIYLSILLLSYFIYSLYSSALSINKTYIIFIIVVSLLYGYLINGQYKKIGYYHKIFAYYFLLITAIFCAIVTLQISRSVMYKNIGLSFEKMDNSALTYFVHASSLNPFDDGIWYIIGQIYFAQNKFDQAKFSLEEAISDSPKDSHNYYALALVYLGLDDKELYRENLIKSIKNNQIGNLERYLLLIKYDIENLKFSEARYYGNKIIKIYSNKYINVSSKDKSIILQIKELLNGINV